MNATLHPAFVALSISVSHNGWHVALATLILSILIVAILWISVTRHIKSQDITIIRETALRAQADTLAKMLQRQTIELEQANRAKLDFLATMSHELRTPLNAIAGYTELLQLGIRGPVTDAQQEDLTRIQQNQRRLLNLINDVLNFAKLDAGTVKYAIKNISLKPVVHSTFSAVEPQLRAKGIKYDLVGNCEKITVYADEEKLGQILTNLFCNAIKFTERGGAVTITCLPTDDHTRISITDTGIGIPADKLEQIFEPFVQVDSALTREHSGIGLGLSISRDLAERMGGEIEVESQLGVGSTFTLILPTANPLTGAASPGTYNLPGHSTLRVQASPRVRAL